MWVIAAQEFIDAPHPATGDVPEDVKGKFGPPHYEWFSTERVKVSFSPVA